MSGVTTRIGPISVGLFLLACSQSASSNNIAMIHEVAHRIAPSSGLRAIQDGPLRVSLVSERSQGKNLVYVALANPSHDFLCISAHMVDVRYQHILLKDATGRHVPLRTYGETRRLTPPGFDYGDAYFVVRPAEKRKIEIDIDNFEIEHGTYTYDIQFLYYRCRDAIEMSRMADGRPIETFGVHDAGSISLSEEK
jgi:hypothetical protein